MKKLWYFLREIIWTNVIALVMVLCAFASVLFYDYELATIFALGAIPFALLSSRS